MYLFSTKNHLNKELYEKSVFNFNKVITYRDKNRKKSIFIISLSSIFYLIEHQ